MLYVQFYQKSAISDDIIEASGDRSVVILDARCSKSNLDAVCEEECGKRGYLAWQRFQGETFNRSVNVGPIQFI